jgi:hypothetical protein
METQVVAVSFKDGNDQLGQHSNIDLKLQADSSELENSLCRGSLAWFGRQTHNLERKGTRRPNPEVAGSNPAPGTTARVWLLGWKCLIKGCAYCCADGRIQHE